MIGKGLHTAAQNKTRAQIKKCVRLAKFKLNRHCEAWNRKGTKSGLLLILVERYLNLNFRSLLLCAVWPWQKCPIFILFGPYCPYHDCLMYHFVPFMYTHHHHSAWYTSFCRIMTWPHMHVAEQLWLLHSLWDLSNYLPNYSPFLFSSNNVNGTP